MTNLLLPKKDKKGIPYLSYSQISIWKKSKREYIRQYFFGESFEGNAYTEFGSMVGEALEKNDFSGFTASEKKFLKTIPRYDEFEREIRLEMEGFYVKGFIDSNDLIDIKQSTVLDGTSLKDITIVSSLLDYKTGDISKKTMEYESDKYIQTEIYAAALQQEFDYIPANVSVVLIGRKGNPFKGEKLKLTKEFVTITRNIDENDIDRVKKEVQEVAEEISEVYKVFLKLNKK